MPNGENYTPHFTFHGFRYIEIYGLDEAPALEDVVALVEYSDMEDTGSVTTSDTLLNALISNTYWGQRGNFLSTPTDCPQRDERMGWSGDAQIFCGTAAYNMNVKQFFDKYITDLNDCQRVDGAYPDVAPQTSRSMYGGSGNNAWGDAGVIIPWTMYIRYGDVSYLEKYYSTPEIKVKTSDDIKFQIVDKIRKYCEKKHYHFITIDGVKVKFSDSFALVRASNTGPNITMRFEAKTKDRLQMIKCEFEEELQKYL